MLHQWQVGPLVLIVAVVAALVDFSVLGVAMGLTLYIPKLISIVSNGEIVRCE